MKKKRKNQCKKCKVGKYYIKNNYFDDVYYMCNKCGDIKDKIK